jgi:hypothetical protein
MTAFQNIVITKSISTTPIRYKLTVDSSTVVTDTALTYEVDGNPVTIDQSFTTVTVINNGSTDLIFSIEPNVASTLALGADGTILLTALGGAVSVSGLVRRLQFVRDSGTGDVIIALELV